MNAFAIAGILTTISACVFGYFVYARNPKRDLNRIFFVLTISITTWGLGVFFIAIENDATRALTIWRLTYSFGVIWIPILFHHFVHIFLRNTDTEQTIQSKAALLASYGVGAAFFFLVQTDSFFPETQLLFSSFYYPIYTTLLYPLFFLWWASVVIYAHIELMTAFFRSEPAKKEQIKYFFLATSLGFTGGAVAFLPPFGIGLYPYGTFAIPLFPIIMTYAMMKHRLMDIRVVITRALLYSVIIAAISWGVIAISTANTLLKARFPNLSPWVIPFLAGSLAFAVGYLFWQESKRSDKLKAAFITVVAHKFRTPLGEIRWLERNRLKAGRKGYGNAT
ncbi:MAG: histidine kinase N-terminal 7TM domain-containing protein [Patescibacteria group bacterium]